MRYWLSCKWTSKQLLVNQKLVFLVTALNDLLVFKPIQSSGSVSSASQGFFWFIYLFIYFGFSQIFEVAKFLGYFTIHAAYKWNEGASVCVSMHALEISQCSDAATHILFVPCCCGGLTWAGCQAPTQLLSLSPPSSARQEEKTRLKKSHESRYGQGDDLPVSNHHGQNRFYLGNI